MHLVAFFVISASKEKTHTRMNEYDRNEEEIEDIDSFLYVQLMMARIGQEEFHPH